MPTIRKRGNEQWHVQVRRKGYPHATSTFATRAEAERWARDVEGEMDRGVYHERFLAESNTLYEVLKRYVDEITPLKKGAGPEAIRIRKLLEDDLCKYKMAALSPIVARDWRERRLRQPAFHGKGNVSGATVRREMDILSAAVNYARREWGIRMENPFELIERPAPARARERRLELGEEELLIKALTPAPRRDDGTFVPASRNPLLLPYVTFAVETAMRRSEILSLTWENIRLDEQTCYLPDTKNGYSRTVPLSKKAVRILKALPQPHGGLVFPITKNALKLGLRRAIERAGLKNFRPHDLRHEGTTRLSKKLPNVIELSAVTGHRDLASLKRYYHPDPKDLAKKIG